jgi:hypothetical protein
MISVPTVSSVKMPISADGPEAVFGGKKQVTMFEMTKHVSGHVK